jgi:hypothetical protein
LIRRFIYGDQSKPLAIIEVAYHENTSFRPSKFPQKFKNQKNTKNIKFPKNYFELVGQGGWPPRSSYINIPPLGSNGLHFVECPHQMRKLLLNLAPGEPLALVQELPCFDNLIELDPLLDISLDMCVHNLISGFMFHAVKFELYWCQFFFYL